MRKHYLIMNHNGQRVHTNPTKKYECVDCTKELKQIMESKKTSLKNAISILEKLKDDRMSDWFKKNPMKTSFTA